MRTYLFKKPHGFTALEVLAVIVLAAFLSVVLLSYYRDSDTDLRARTLILKTHIRYAQSRAMNTDTQWGVRFNADQRTYWLFKDPLTEERIAFPGQTSESVDLGALGLDITGEGFYITFDGWGRPTLRERSFTNGELTLSLNRNGTDGDTIIIAENTGFIP